MGCFRAEPSRGQGLPFDWLWLDFSGELRLYVYLLLLMKTDLLEILCCPRCLCDLDLEVEEGAGDDVCTGKLLCSSCKKKYQIENGIPDLLISGNNKSETWKKHKRIRQANELVYESKSDDYKPEDVQGFSLKELYVKFENLSLLCGKRRLLDLGCGTGLVANVARSLFQRIVGIDISMSMLRQVDRQIDLIRGDICLLPFKKETFDCVTAMAVLHHIYDTSYLLKESFRVLKPGGYLYTDIDHNWRFFYIYRWVMRMQQLLGIQLLPDRDMARELASLAGDVSGKVPSEIVALAEYH